MFCGCFNSSSDLKQWKTLLKNADLVPIELILETLKFWCSNALASSSFIGMMSRLYLVIRAICDLEGIHNFKKSYFGIIIFNLFAKVWLVQQMCLARGGIRFERRLLKAIKYFTITHFQLFVGQ